MSDSISQIQTFIEKNIRNYTDDSRQLSEVAYACLRDAILYTDIHAGDPLSEHRLSKALNVSRTPLRAAIQKLAQEGMLQVIPGRAVVIASRSPQQVIDGFGVRMLLEPEACRSAALTLDQWSRERLQEYTQRLIDAAHTRDRSAWSQADHQWHQIIADACPNQLLGKMVMQAYFQMRVHGVVPLISTESLLPGTQEHVEMADAILHGDGARAADLMRQHLQSARDRLFLTDLLPQGVQSPKGISGEA